MYLLTLIILTFLLPLVLVSGGIKKGMLPYAVLLQSTLFLGLSIVLLFGFAWATGEPLGTSILKEMEISVKTIVETPSLLKVVGLEGMSKAEATSMLTSAYALVINMLPSSIICWGIIFSYFDYFIISTIKKKRGKAVLMLPAFSSFSLPRKAIYGSMLIYALSWITVSMNIIPEEAMLLNVQALILFIFAGQGLAVALYTTSRKRIPRILSWITCAVLFLSPFGRGFLALLGFFDLLVGLRQKIEKQ